MIGRAERNKSSPWPGVMARMAEGSRMACSRVDVETGPSATGLGGLAELAFGAITNQPGDVGQIIGVGTAAEHDFHDGGVPDPLGLLSAPAVSGLGE